MEAIPECLFDTTRVDAWKIGSKRPLVGAKAAPPVWHLEGLLTRGQRHVKVNAPPHTTLHVLSDCFNSKLAAEVAKQTWALHITAFLAYEAVHLKVEVYCNPQSDAHTDILLQLLQDDVVQFGHLCSIAIGHLSTNGLQVLEPEAAARSSCQMLVDGGLYEDPCEFEEDWPTMFASMLRAAGSPAASLRQQGLQALARWAEHRRDCVPDLADAMLRHSELVGRLLQAPLAECYPVAVALKIASGCPRNAERLAWQILPLILCPKNGLPSLVARELEETFGNLTMAAVARRRPRFRKVVELSLGETLEESAIAISGGFSRASTEPSTASASMLGESKAVTVDS